VSAEREDHVALAREGIEVADMVVSRNLPLQTGEFKADVIAVAQVHATLALVEQQRVANLFAALHTSVAGPDRAGWSEVQREQIIAGILDGLGLA
jgi:hypothetical protein